MGWARKKMDRKKGKVPLRPGEWRHPRGCSVRNGFWDGAQSARACGLIRSYRRDQKGYNRYDVGVLERMERVDAKFDFNSELDKMQEDWVLQSKSSFSVGNVRVVSTESGGASCMLVARR